MYSNLSIKNPNQLGIKQISKKLDLKIYYGNASIRFGNSVMLLNSTKQKQWQKFGHEVCHYLIHCGQQLNMHYLFRDLQENQANYFSYHFCVPTFMLQELRGVTIYDVMNLFNVEYDFALKRLEMYERKMINARSHC